jgi:F-type H+-transporting ATPase subunit c
MRWAFTIAITGVSGVTVIMKALRLAVLVLMVVLLASTPALAGGEKAAQAPAVTAPPGTYVLTGGAIAAGVGAGLTIIGAGYGFGRIGSAALEGMARQPEVAGRVQTAMLIIAALLEGATFFALIVCIIAGGHTGL